MNVGLITLLILKKFEHLYSSTVYGKKILVAKRAKTGAMPTSLPKAPSVMPSSRDRSRKDLMRCMCARTQKPRTSRANKARTGGGATGSRTGGARAAAWATINGPVLLSIGLSFALGAAIDESKITVIVAVHLVEIVAPYGPFSPCPPPAPKMNFALFLAPKRRERPEHPRGHEQAEHPRATGTSRRQTTATRGHRGHRRQAVQG